MTRPGLKHGEETLTKCPICETDKNVEFVLGGMKTQRYLRCKRCDWIYMFSGFGIVPDGTPVRFGRMTKSRKKKKK